MTTGRCDIGNPLRFATFFAGALGLLLGATGAAALKADAAGVPGTLLVEAVRGTDPARSTALILVAPTGGRPRTLITRQPVDYELPVWSRDGTRVAYGRCAERGDSVHCRIGISDARTRKATLSPNRGTAPSWAPDGRRLAFTAGDTTTDWGRLATMPARGGRARLLAPGLVVGAPAWSPDGSYIAFVALPLGADDARPWLYVIRPNGQGLRPLVPLQGETDVWGTLEAGELRPSWSPDAKSIATVGDGGMVLQVVDLQGQIRWRLDPDPRLPGEVYAVWWSPDGRRLIFDGDGTIYVVNRDGGGVRALSVFSAGPRLHGWGPTSRTVAITRSGGLFLVNLQGRERKLLSGRYEEVAWGWPQVRRGSD